MHDHAAIAERYQLEASHAWFKARQRLIIWAIRKHFPQTSNFLEIGVGTGVMISAIAKAFPNMPVYGADREWNNLLFLSNYINLHRVTQLDAAHLPFESAFDLIGMFDVLEHIEEDVAVLSEINRSLKPSGGLILTVPQHPFLWSRYDEYDEDYGSHKRRYTRSELLSKVSNAGFAPVFVTSIISLLLPAMIATRLLPLRTPITPLTGLRPNRLTNACVNQLLMLEYCMIRAGVNFPCGGSLLLLARKS